MLVFAHSGLPAPLPRFFPMTRSSDLVSVFYVNSPASDVMRRSPTIDAKSLILDCRPVRGKQPFQFTIFPEKDGYQLRVNHGSQEYLWPDFYPTLEKVGEEILRTLTTAAECRGETEQKSVSLGKYRRARRPCSSS